MLRGSEGVRTAWLSTVSQPRKEAWQKPYIGPPGSALDSLFSEVSCERSSRYFTALRTRAKSPPTTKLPPRNHLVTGSPINPIMMMLPAASIPATPPPTGILLMLMPGCGASLLGTHDGIWPPFLLLPLYASSPLYAWFGANDPSSPEFKIVRLGTQTRLEK